MIIQAEKNKFFSKLVMTNTESDGWMMKLLNSE